MLIKNKSNRSFYFTSGTHHPGETKQYDDDLGNIILKSYPGNFKEIKPKKSGGKKCHK